jgi:hypothetical protein
MFFNLLSNASKCSFLLFHFNKNFLIRLRLLVNFPCPLAQSAVKHSGHLFLILKLKRSGKFSETFFSFRPSFFSFKIKNKCPAFFSFLPSQVLIYPLFPTKSRAHTLAIKYFIARSLSWLYSFLI